MKRNFKVGDIVKFEKFGFEKHPGTGRILEIETGAFNYDVLVEVFGELRGKGHNGNGFSREKYAGNNCWFFKESELDLLRNEIHITTDGETTHAVMKIGGSVVKRSKAVCSKDDVFDFQTWAKIAFERLFEKEVEEPVQYVQYVQIINNDHPIRHAFKNGDVCKIIGTSPYGNYICKRLSDGLKQTVKNESFKALKAVARAAKAGEYIMLTRKAFSFNIKNEILKVSNVLGSMAEVLKEDHACFDNSMSEVWRYVESEYVVLEGYVPPLKELHLFSLLGDCGAVGKRTKIKDTNGTTLCIGDTVHAVRKENGEYLGELVVVFVYGKAFVKGIEMDCKPDGTIDGYTVVKADGYEKLKEGDEIQGETVKAVKRYEE